MVEEETDSCFLVFISPFYFTALESFSFSLVCGSIILKKKKNNFKKDSFFQHTL